ncbi:hypothetical protein CCACVL1_01131, partial [Corchorus capsularis]
ENQTNGDIVVVDVLGVGGSEGGDAGGG